jgi:predicted CoA-binding protein
MEQVRGFLAQKRIAIVGVSQEATHFSRTLFREFSKKGYDAIPVNPTARAIEGQPCFARVQDISPPVEAVLLMTPATATPAVVRDCREAGVKRVWMYRAAGVGAVDPGAVRYCEENGMSVIPGECPLMFLPGAAWFHRAHGLVRRITGAYPR